MMITLTTCSVVKLMYLQRTCCIFLSSADNVLHWKPRRDHAYIFSWLQWNLDITMSQSTDKICSSYRGFFPYSIVYFCCGKENRSLYRGLRYVEVRNIEVPLYNYTHNCNDLEYTSHTTFMFVFNNPVMKKKNKQTKEAGILYFKRRVSKC